MNYLRKFKNRFIIKVELVSALDDSSFLISPPNGFPEETIPVEYNNIYFTITSISLQQNSKVPNAGSYYVVKLDFTFPYFEGTENFMERFKYLSEIRLTLNTNGLIRINKNDIALNKPLEAEFQTSLKTVGFSVSVSQLLPFKINE
ncbi:Uncharacterised protein [Chryseobacterium nakagawai]|uniref:Uncharacterized protein n=1 Tax=Chryseobacterium nakagawai TaxID=1241982 RepID=A0AAD0YQW6_CHRNA|nr:hypothetical protein [Chryseobacterium nakagawai]AZA93028.1 hypothetical protein EG343_21705 [Chryseobacterium nakagawai]VEH19660.1 Uncharacterised protein [Chryseobacterium nakagawai]